MEQEEFQQLRDYLHLQLYPVDFKRPQKKALKRKVKKFKYDPATNHLFHFTKSQVCLLLDFYGKQLFYFFFSYPNRERDIGEEFC
jgi:hypothetical protein